MENVKFLRADVNGMTEMAKIDGNVKRIRMISFK
jgi:hypothetical protein